MASNRQPAPTRDDDDFAQHQQYTADTRVGRAPKPRRHGTPTQAQVFTVLGAAEAYVHLFTYPIRGFAVEQVRDIARAVRANRKIKKTE